MIDVIENKIKEEKELTTKSKKELKKYTILGISIWRILEYFIIYSILGFIIETLFGLAKYGTIESRKSFIYGPFCAIYGLGAVCMILPLQFYKKKYNSLFLSGCVLGSIIEYIVSFVGEKLLNVKWWDYSSVPLNLNGRICLLYSVFWGILALYLMISLNPKIDKLLDWIKSKISSKLLKSIIIISCIFLLLDCLITAYALSNYMARMIVEKNIEVSNYENIEKIYNVTNNNEKLKNITDKYFGNEKMVKTFPRLKIENKNGEIIYFSSLLPEIQPYYFKLENSKLNDLRNEFN